MNNYYSLIYLTEHLKIKLVESSLLFSLSPHRNVWEGYFETTDNDVTRLVFSANPGETALFTDSFRPPKKTNTLTFFDDLDNHRVEDVHLAENDRLISLRFYSGQQLLFQLFGNKANLFQINRDIITDSFKNSDRYTGTHPPEPRPPGNRSGEPAKPTAKNRILHVDQKFPRQLLTPVIRQYELENAPPEKIEATVYELTRVMREQPAFRVLSGNRLCLLPSHLLQADEIETFESINDCIRFAWKETVRRRRFTSKMNALKGPLEKLYIKTAAALEKVSTAEDTEERARVYEQMGHLLMSQAHKEIPWEQETIEVENFYNNNKIQTIPVKPGLTMAENAQRYYKKSSKARRSTVESQQRKNELTKRREQLQQALASLEVIDMYPALVNWEKSNSDMLRELGVHSGSDQKQSLPYRKTVVEGYEIRIGKNAKSNDELTRQAHKEDIWLHARGTSGSHVIIRMNNRDGFPPHHILKKAAAFAAWYSGLRGSGLVPVIVTKRKHVSKPKNASAGAVRVSKEKVELVSPVKP